MKSLIFAGVVLVCLLELTVAEHGCTTMQDCHNTGCNSTNYAVYELHCMDKYCVCEHVTIPPQTCNKSNGNSDCTKNTCHRHDFGRIHWIMKCVTARNGQDECHCGATYSHQHGGSHSGGGPVVPDLGNILSAGQIP